MVEQVLTGGFPLSQFRSYLVPRTAPIRDAGYPELAQAISDDLICLETELQGLQELQTAGVSSYVAARAGARLAAWRGAQVCTRLGIDTQRDRVTRIEAATTESSSVLGTLSSRIEVCRARASRLRQELQVVESDILAFEGTLADKQRTHTTMTQELECARQKLGEMEEEAARTFSVSEESFRSDLQRELEQAYTDDLSRGKERVRRYKFNI